MTLRLAALLVVSVSTAPVAAQGFDRTGVVLTVRAQSVGVGADNPNASPPGDIGAEGGLGAEVGVGVGFTRLLTGFASLGGARLEGDDAGVLAGSSYSLGVVDLGVRFNALPGARLNPYGVVAVTGQAAVSDGAEAYGSGLTFGGGADVAALRSVFLDLGLGVTWGQFGGSAGVDTGEADLEPSDVVIARVHLGVRFAP